MVKKKEKKKFKTKNIMTIVFGVIVIAVVIGYLLTFVPEKKEEITNNEINEISEKSEIIQAGGSCKSDSGCFTIKCIDETAYTCLNTEKYIDTLLRCGSHDVSIIRDEKLCACIQGTCATP